MAGGGDGLLGGLDQRHNALEGRGAFEEGVLETLRGTHSLVNLHLQAGRKESLHTHQPRGSHALTYLEEIRHGLGMLQLGGAVGGNEVQRLW